MTIAPGSSLNDRPDLETLARSPSPEGLDEDRFAPTTDFVAADLTAETEKVERAEALPKTAGAPPTKPSPQEDKAAEEKTASDDDQDEFGPTGVFVREDPAAITIADPLDEYGPTQSVDRRAIHALNR